jgi:RNA polymerase sigma-70 factor (ECF subfamily)
MSDEIVPSSLRPTGDDRALGLRVANGDEHAFRQMYELCSEGVFRYLCSLTHDTTIAEDLTQETFGRVWHTRTTLHAGESWRAYVFSIGRNLAFQYLRHQRVVATTHQALLDDMKTTVVPGMELDPSSADADLVFRDELQRLEHAIGQLPARMQEVFRLRWQSELSYREIAQTLGISERTVENHLARALFLVRQAMGSED